MNNPLAPLFARHRSLVLFDTETTGLDPENDRIIELAALKVEPTPTYGLRIAAQMDAYIRLPEGQTVPDKIIELTGITDETLHAEGIAHREAAEGFVEMISDGPVLLIAHNAQFDLSFLNAMLQREELALRAKTAMLDTLTVFRDRRQYPHKLADAIDAYGLGDRVKNSHRAIDDVLALFEVLKAMATERDDIARYVNLFGYNPKYGVTGRRISGIRYEPQPYNTRESIVDRIARKRRETAANK